MSNIVITQTTKNCAGICRHFGVKVFISIFGVEKINLASPDDHFSNIDFAFYFDTWYHVRSANEAIDET